MRERNKFNLTKEDPKIEIDDTIELSVTGVLDEMEKGNKALFEESHNVDLKENKISNKAKKILLIVAVFIVIISSSVIALATLEKNKSEAKNNKENKVVSKVNKNNKENINDEEKKEEENKEEKENNQEAAENKDEDSNKTEVSNNTVQENNIQENKVQEEKKIETRNDNTKTVETKNYTTTVMPVGENFLSEVENIVYQKINEERSKAGVQSLVNSERIKKYARVKVKDMADNGYLASKDLSGNSITVYMKNDGVTYGSWGENIGYVTYNSDSTTLAEKFTNNFMNSTSSKDKILSGTYSEVGIGIYKSGDRVYIAEEFIR
ncbi:CAP domain-containing protein [uncultured Clostridium sp.]|uniref:CAP domain-containing protein n=1 Tax=uncultured Clostridium sp. TaxID=59620 RepID=UPI0025D61D19|nr:CAP domain-containing protein [uncultured Clostridium sp.]